jgi:hypothetical protein
VAPLGTALTTVTASVCVLVGLIDFNALALVLMMATAGFCAGMTMPSRDLIVRAVTPTGAYGRVFGFVSTGFKHRRHRVADHLRPVSRSWPSARHVLLHGRLRAARDRHGRGQHQPR